MVAHGNGKMLSKTLHQSRGEQYLDVEEAFYSRCVNTKTCITDPLIQFEEHIGKYGPSASNIRDLYSEVSNFYATFDGMSNVMRQTIEIQMVGCNLSSRSDQILKFN